MTAATVRLRGACLTLLLLLPAAASAQIRLSERGGVWQTIDGTVITVEYSRPQVRGRDSTIFGKFVHWGEVWTPGANFASTLEINRPIQLDGHPVKPGKYSMWLVVQPDQWTMVLDPRVRLYHVPFPDSTADQLRYPVKPGTGPFTETLTFTFQDVRAEEGTLLLRWGAMELPFKIAVEPKHKLTMPEADAKPFLGTYAFRWAGQPDSVAPSKVSLTYENGMLIGRWVPAPFPDVANIVLVRIQEDAFMVGSMSQGKLVDLMDEWVFEFARRDGRVTKFEAWTDGDTLDGTGTRQ
jgi:hypothetical protein